MKRVNLKTLSVDELVERFAEIARAQDKALLGDDVAKFKNLFTQMTEVDLELRFRGTPARLTLLRLYDDPNCQVRLKAAKRTLGVAPQAARSLIESIAKSSWFPQAGEAGMTLANLDSGVFKPD